jgi:hypothetical protein
VQQWHPLPGSTQVVVPESGAVIFLDAKGNPYTLTGDGQAAYMPPQDYAQRMEGIDQTTLKAPGDAAPQGDFLHNVDWNPDIGQYESTLDKGGLLSLGVGGIAGAGIAAGALGGGAAVAPDVGAEFVGPTAGEAGAGVGAVGGGASTFVGPISGESAAAGSAAAGAGDLGTTMAIPGSAGVGAGEAGISAVAPVTGGVSGTGIAEIGAGTSTLGKIANALKNPSTLGDIAGAIGKGVGGAATASGNNDLINAGLGLDANAQDIAGRNAYIDQVSKLAQLGLTANDQNIAGNKAYSDAIAQQAALRNAAKNTDISGENAYVNQELGMAGEEDKQRASAYKDIARASLLRGLKKSPYDPSPVMKLSPTLQAAMADLEQQGGDRLHKPASYDVANLDRPTKYTPVDLGPLPAPTPYSPYSVGALPTPQPYQNYTPKPVGQGTLNDVSNWLSPTLTTAGAIADILKRA